MLKTLLKLLPKTEIDDECKDNAGLLMTRYYLTPKIFGLRLVIHCFHRSDNDRHYHDHPWNFISFILKGSYIEHFPVKGCFRNIDGIITNEYDFQQAHRRFDIIKRPKEWKHWVELLGKFVAIDNGIVTSTVYHECWTLVLFYGKRRDWGFHTEQGWVKHDEYDCRGNYDKSNSPTRS